MGLIEFPSYLHSKSEYSNEDFEDESQRQQPHGPVDSWPCGPIGQIVSLGAVEVTDVFTELGGVQKATVIEQLRDQFAGAHPGVLVGEGQDGCDGCHHNHLRHGVLAQLGGLAPPAPGYVAADEEGPPEATKDPQEDEGHQLQQMPRSVELHIEQDKAAVPKGIDGAQGEGCHQCSKEGPPQCLERKIVADLGQRGADSVPGVAHQTPGLNYLA